ncbi:von Willebrand factor D and EGF domain-containing protein-like isoform X2 [Cryptotermes secundus]|uniref:von Willebrand factor D and EGF domain-containing protein-like isoform X2 n=1 Tax=Cryptotermes secundus TaxID=105785 RepID=UPI000CD7B442|nr:von Willebrand factor D and EGF domain-containing protein-like isoform X2 [Cryptotermes secundus]
MFPFKMRNFSLTLLFAVIVGIVGDSGKVWERNSATRNVIGFMNEVIEKPERMNEATGRQKLKSAGNGRACNAGYKLHANGLLCVPVCAKECVNAYCYLPNFCRCLDGYDKKHVNSNVCLPACPDGCSNGHCIAPNTCVCLPGHQNPTEFFFCHRLHSVPTHRTMPSSVQESLRERLLPQA